jgi:hypothetical protein
LYPEGSQAPATDFLARNGLRYGQIYGFATELATHRDTFHINATNGAKVSGKWLKGQWRWNGTVLPFIYDGSWDFQNQPVGYFGTNYTFWNSRGKIASGLKQEHNTPGKMLVCKFCITNYKTLFIHRCTVPYCY